MFLYLYVLGILDILCVFSLYFGFFSIVHAVLCCLAYLILDILLCGWFLTSVHVVLIVRVFLHCHTFL